jgi:hypothetical protein
MTEKQVDDIYTNSEEIEFPGGMSCLAVTMTDLQLERDRGRGKDLMRSRSVTLPMREPYRHLSVYPLI